MKTRPMALIFSQNPDSARWSRASFGIFLFVAILESFQQKSSVHRAFPLENTEPNGFFCSQIIKRFSFGSMAPPRGSPDGVRVCNDNHLWSTM